MSPKTVAFFGASTGCGLAALKHSLAAGYHCQALLRTPSKLNTHFPTLPANLTVIPGNAHDLAKVQETITSGSNPTSLVHVIFFSIGGAFSFSSFSLDDPHVCATGMATLLNALSNLRASGVTGSPRIVCISTTGISKSGRDVPLVYKPLVAAVLRGPHADKREMEEKVVVSGESWTMVRPTILGDGETEKVIRVGVEDPVKGWEKKEVGYMISREDVGKWTFKEVIEGGKYEKKFVTLTW